MAETHAHTFQAEIKQLLNILVHSLYKDRDIFLRELISNASDALNRLQFEQLTNPDILDPEAELAVYITVDEENKTLTLSDTGVGMTADEMVDSLGVIARSGARAFLDTLEEQPDSTVGADIIGQFGVGFYSVFMVADRVEVTSRSFRPEAEAATWISSGEDTYEILPADKDTRGTDIVIYLREDADEFASEWQIKQIIRQHSDYINFPIYVGKAEEDADYDQANQQIALWRQNSGDVEDEDYQKFYSSLTLDHQEPRMHIHVRGDAPIQYYALLYIPHSPEKGMFHLRKDPGLKLYARKVLIQDYTTDLLPEYLGFVEGVVDSEDLPLNVSRETIQRNPVVAKLKQVVSGRVLSEFSRIADSDPEAYADFWAMYSPFLKQGLVTEFSDREKLLPLMRFVADSSDGTLISLDTYVEGFVKGQEDIYYVVAEDVNSAARSPHLDPFRARGIDVLYFTETVDGFLINALQDYKGHKLVSVDSAELDLDGIGTRPEEDESEEALPEDEAVSLVDYIQNILGEAVESVRVSKVLSSGSPARLVAPQGSLDRHQQRLYQMLEQEFEVPARILEINPRHPIIRNLSAMLDAGADESQLMTSINLLYQNALLADGIHPNPADMVADIQALLEQATRSRD